MTSSGHDVRRLSVRSGSARRTASRGNVEAGSSNGSLTQSRNEVNSVKQVLARDERPDEPSTHVCEISLDDCDDFEPSAFTNTSTAAGHVGRAKTKIRPAKGEKPDLAAHPLVSARESRASKVCPVDHLVDILHRSKEDLAVKGNSIKKTNSTTIQFDQTTIKTLKDADEWKNTFTHITGIDYVMKSSETGGMKRWHCSFSKVNKNRYRIRTDCWSKCRDCPAFMSILLPRQFGRTPRKYARVTVKSDHHGHTDSFQDLSSRPPSMKAKEKYTEKLRSGQPVSAAKQQHIKELECEYGVRACEMQADSSINPTDRQIYHMRNRLLNAELGGRSIEGVLKKIREMLPELNEQGVTVLVHDDPFVLTMQTELMNRVASATNDNTLVFIDSTSSCDGFSSVVTPVLVETAAGGMPVALSISASENQSAYEQIFRDLVTLVPFGGRREPAFIMHDDSRALENAAAAVFPTSQQLLCGFHLLQAAWSWLKSKVSEQAHRLQLLGYTKDLIYSVNEMYLYQKHEQISRSRLLEEYPEFKKRIDAILNRKELIVHCFRSPAIRGHNTNNISESFMCILKECVLRRTKCFNPVGLLNTLVEGLDAHLRNRLLSVAFSRRRQYFRNQAKLLRRVATRDGFSLQPDENGQILVPSASHQNVHYTVTLADGLCNCFLGNVGRYCKHVAAVEAAGTQVVDPVLRATTVASRHRLYYLATGLNEARHKFTLNGVDDTSEICPLPAPSAHIANPQVVYELDDESDVDTTDEQVATAAVADEAAQKVREFLSGQSAETAMKVVRKLNRLQPRQFVDLILQPAHQKRFVCASYIKTQVTATARRQKSTSRARVAVSRGKPAKLSYKTPAPAKRPHSLRANVQEGHNSAKKSKK